MRDSVASGYTTWSYSIKSGRSGLCVSISSLREADGIIGGGFLVTAENFTEILPPESGQSKSTSRSRLPAKPKQASWLIAIPVALMHAGRHIGAVMLIQMSHLVVLDGFSTRSGSRPAAVLLRALHSIWGKIAAVFCIGLWVGISESREAAYSTALRHRLHLRLGLPSKGLMHIKRSEGEKRGDLSYRSGSRLRGSLGPDGASLCSLGDHLDRRPRCSPLWEFRD